MLNGIFGKVAGGQAEYAGKYSKGLVAAGAAGTVWTAETLASYVENPKSVASDSKMAFAGIKKPEEREDLIAYLLTFSPDYKPAN
jgi:cytochrome c